ncbi:hypothetical protein H1R20_g14434, partial [Candolleomyces eurysporus]
MIQGQIYAQQLKNVSAARTAYANEEDDGKDIKARAFLEKARLAVPKDERLWAESARVEERSSGAGSAQAKLMLARALQECPTSGLLWSMNLWAEHQPTRKFRSVDPLKKSSGDPLIVCTVARLFWQERKIKKAREWLRRAVKVDKDIGDVWGRWLKFEKQYGTEEYQEIVKRGCESAG